MKRPGPELKMPDVKLPAFAVDVYDDLRDRRLLPLVALIVVAIAAVPFLLGGDAEAPVEVAPSDSGDGVVGGASGGASFAVVEATPGLRDYRKRLRRQDPTDPFDQQYAAPQGGGGSGGSGGGSTGGGSGGSAGSSGGGSGSSIPSGGSGSDSGGSSGGGSSGGSGDGGIRLIEFRFTVQVSHSEKTASGGQKMSEPQVRRRVPALTQLPGKKVPVVAVAGVNLHNGKVFFLVSDDVRSLDGDFTCKTRPPNGLCELLEIEPGFPLEAVYGQNKARYRFKVTKIEAVRAGKPGDGGSTESARDVEDGILQNFSK
jgi:hypothetical protein